MKIFVAGASGSVGRRLVPLLVGAGHDVVGTTRHSPAAVHGMGAEAVVLDVLDAEAVHAAVLRARPEVVIHEATALAGLGSLRRFDREFAQTNRLRTTGTDLLLAAAREAGTRRFLGQSFAGWPYAREGGPVKTEDDPLDPDPPASARETLAAIRHLERAVAASGLEGLVLRYGGLYGPGTSIAEGAPHAELVRGRRFPIVGDGAGIWSFVHVDDAAAATLAAVERGAPGVYNVVDDDPAPVREWLPYLAIALDAPPPRHVPGWVGRLAAGEQGVSMMTRTRGASNAGAKRELGWDPRWASWRQGFVDGLGDAVQRAA